MSLNQAPDAQEQFVRVQNAYAVLSDPDARAHYDWTGMAPATGLDSMARSMVLQTFVQIAQSKGWVPWPYVRDIRSKLQGDRRKAETAVRDAELALERLDTILPATDGENIFQFAIDDARAKILEQREHATRGLAQIDAGLALLEVYTDTAEEPARMSYVFTQTSSSA